MQAVAADSATVYDALVNGLPDLIRGLRRHGYKTGIDQLLAAQHLFRIWQQQPPLPSEIIGASLAALFSTSIDEQQRFRPLFQDWYNACFPDYRPELIIARQPPKKPIWPEKVTLDNKARIAIILWSILIFLAMWRYWQHEEKAVRAPETIITGTQKIPLSLIESAIPTPPVNMLPAPRMPPEPIVVPEQFYFQYTAFVKTGFGLPLLIWLILLAKRLRERYLTLSKRRAKAGEKSRLEALRFKTADAWLFPHAAMKSALRTWRQYQPFRSRRLHAYGTVRRTLAQNGYFQPVFRERLLPPEFVLLIDRRHLNDHAAGLAGELKRRLHAEGLFIHAYQYDTDPRFCWSDQQKDRCFTLEQLANRHQGQRLIVIGEARCFYRLLEDKHQPWGLGESWSDQLLLTVNTPEDWGVAEQTLLRSGFNVAPFTRRGIERLDAFSHKFKPDKIRLLRTLDYRDTPLPAELLPHRFCWLDDKKPDKRIRQQTVKALKGYLGREGYCLLAAAAAYPALDWRLTLALDVQLAFEDGEYRELRLRKLARLSWLRNGVLPDVWRRIILRNLEQVLLDKIQQAFQSLLNWRSNPNNKYGSLIDLPVVVPDLTTANRDQREWIDSAPAGDPLQDKVFASVIQGRKPDLLEFTLSAEFEQWFPPEYWRGLVGRAAAGFVLASGVIYAASTAWRDYGEPFLLAQALAEMRRTLGDYRIDLAYSEPEMSTLGPALQHVLTEWGFQVSLVPTSSAALKQKLSSLEFNNALNQPNQLSFSRDSSDEIVWIAEQRIRYMTFGAEVETYKVNSLPPKTMFFIYRKAYETGQSGAFYRDVIHPYAVEQNRDKPETDGKAAENLEPEIKNAPNDSWSSSRVRMR